MHTCQTSDKYAVNALRYHRTIWNSSGHSLLVGKVNQKDRVHRIAVSIEVTRMQRYRIRIFFVVDDIQRCHKIFSINPAALARVNKRREVIVILVFLPRRNDHSPLIDGIRFIGKRIVRIGVTRTQRFRRQARPLHGDVFCGRRDISSTSYHRDIAVAGRIHHRSGKHNAAAVRGDHDYALDRAIFYYGTRSQRGEPNLPTGLTHLTAPPFTFGHGIPPTLALGTTHRLDALIDFGGKSFAISKPVVRNQPQRTHPAKMILIFNQ